MWLQTRASEVPAPGQRWAASVPMSAPPAPGSAPAYRAMRLTTRVSAVPAPGPRGAASVPLSVPLAPGSAPAVRANPDATAAIVQILDLFGTLPSIDRKNVRNV